MGRLQIAHVMQVVYRLDVVSLAMKHITSGSNDDSLQHLCWTSNGHILTVWIDPAWIDPADSGSSLAVYDCSGQCTAQFWLPEHILAPSTAPGCRWVLACAAGNRVAAAAIQNFSVWDLQSGELVGTRGPVIPAAQGPAGAQAGLITANKTGSNFCAQGSTAVYLYDATTLDALDVVHPAGKDMLARLVSDGCRLCGLAWEIGGFMMYLHDP